MSQHTAGEDPDSYQAFYQASYGHLVAHLYALTGDLGEAQDAAQEAFVRAWNHWPRLSRYDNPVAWVRLTGQRIAISRWRRARTALRSWVRHGVASPSPGPGPESVALVDALKQLPEAQRRAVVQHHMGGLTVAEIAAEEGVPLGTIKARLHRGRTALAGLLGEPAAEAPPTRPLGLSPQPSSGPSVDSGPTVSAAADAERSAPEPPVQPEAESALEPRTEPEPKGEVATHA